MRLADQNIGPYEGLIFSTARRYSDYLDHELEDIQQILRLKVAQALAAFDSSRDRRGEESYVFGCVRNRVKDLLKEQSRRNDARGGGPLFMADQPDQKLDRIMSVTEEEVFLEVDDEEFQLPSSLSKMERTVVVLLMLDMNQSEIARHLGVSRQKIRTAHATVRVKLADWRPSGTEIARAVTAA